MMMLMTSMEEEEGESVQFSQVPSQLSPYPHQAHGAGIKSPAGKLSLIKVNHLVQVHSPNLNTSLSYSRASCEFIEMSLMVICCSCPWVLPHTSQDSDVCPVNGQ